MMSNPVETAVVPMRANIQVGGKPMAIVPQSFDDVWRIATLMSKTAMVPEAYRGKEADCAVAIMYGLELGMSPVVALQSIAVVNGRPSVWGDALVTLCHRAGHKLVETIEGEGDEMVAKCVMHNKDGTQTPRTFSVKDAKTADLWGKNVWKKYPKRMLQMRARGFAIRDGAAEVLAGASIVEEQQDVVPMRDVTPKKPIAATLPDIPEDPPANDDVIDPPAQDDVPDHQAVLREMQGKLATATPEQAHEFAMEYAERITEMDEVSRTDAIDMIEAAKAGLL